MNAKFSNCNDRVTRKLFPLEQYWPVVMKGEN